MEAARRAANDRAPARRFARSRSRPARPGWGPARPADGRTAACRDPPGIARPAAGRPAGGWAVCNRTRPGPRRSHGVRARCSRPTARERSGPCWNGAGRAVSSAPDGMSPSGWSGRIGRARPERPRTDPTEQRLPGGDHPGASSRIGRVRWPAEKRVANGEARSRWDPAKLAIPPVVLPFLRIRNY
jgi:hypothetical protein